MRGVIYDLLSAKKLRVIETCSNQDSQAVIEKFKSGFLPPEDIPFEDLSNPLLERINNSTPSSVPHHSSQRLDSVRSSFSGGSVKAKRKTRLLNIFSGSKVLFNLVI